jgi:hypothetical protein
MNLINKSPWKFLGRVTVDIGILLIADEQHFRDLHNKWEEDYESALESYNKAGYIPETGGDGSWNIYGYIQEGKFQHIFLEYGELQGEYEKFIEFKKDKIKSLKIDTGKIAINDPSAWYSHEVDLDKSEDFNNISVQNSFNCPLGIGNYDIYESVIIYKPFDSDKLITSRFGVIINLNHKT